MENTYCLSLFVVINYLIVCGNFLSIISAIPSFKKSGIIKGKTQTLRVVKSTSVLIVPKEKTVYHNVPKE